MVLLVIQTLNVYKPRGMTRYGWRKQQEQRVVMCVQSNVMLTVSVPPAAVL